MALKRLTIDGYGQIELNQVAFRRDGRIEAQCKLGTGLDYVENGMLLAVNNITRTVNYPTATDKLIALNYTTEHMYDERTTGLKYFKLDKDTFLPRLGYLAAGDKFTTNCLAYDDTEFAAVEDNGDTADVDEIMTADESVKAAVRNCGNTALYGKACANGAIQLTATIPTVGPILQVIKATTMPDGQFAAKFIVLG